MINKEHITAFLPCRKGSKRIASKNTRPFGGVKGGLVEIKLAQLICVESIHKIVVSTNDEIVIDIAKSIDNPKIAIDNRPAPLAKSTTSTDELINYVPTIISEGPIIWTHVTSPFVSAEIYTNAIRYFFNNRDQYDSVMSVTRLQKFLWNKAGPLNYDRTIEKWPRTQTITPLFEVNSAFFIADIETYRQERDRIGVRPALYELDLFASLDIDWEEDFHFAEKCWQNRK